MVRQTAFVCAAIGASGGGASDEGLELGEPEGMNASGPSECPIDFNGVEVW